MARGPEGVDWYDRLPITCDFRVVIEQGRQPVLSKRTGPS